MIDDPDAVVSLDAWKLRKAKATPVCEHKRTVIDERLGVVECRDCGATLSAFWVLSQIAREENRCFERVNALRQEADQLRAWVPFLRSMRHLERLWRGRKMLPTCPHCRHGLWPDELTTGAINAEVEKVRRVREAIPVPMGASVNLEDANHA